MNSIKAVYLRTRFSVGRMLREAGLALDRKGSVLTHDIAYLEPLSRHRHIMPIYEARPAIVENAFIAPNASILGEVYISDHSSIWYGTVIHGDVNPVRIGNNTVIGDNTVVNSAMNLPAGVPASVNIGNNVTVGSHCTLYSCTIDDNVTVGDKCLILEGARLERGCSIGPNSVVAPGRVIPAGQHWEGNPVTFVRELSKSETEASLKNAKQTVETIAHHDQSINADPVVARLFQNAKQL